MDWDLEAWDGSLELFDDDPDGWRPDWSVENEYAPCKNLTPEGWAWEFIRRNKKYHEHWEWEETKCESAFSAFHFEELVGLPWDGEELPDEEPICELIEGQLRVIRGINLKSCAMEWGFYPPFNPKVDAAEITLLPGPSDPDLQAGCVYDLQTFLDRTEDVRFTNEPFGFLLAGDIEELEWLAAAVLDLNQEMTWQVQKIKKEALKLQIQHLGDDKPKRIGPRFGDLVEYLRILDAESRRLDDEYPGFTRLEIARVLWPRLYGSVKDRLRNAAKRNAALIRREARESEERGRALAAVRSTLRQARQMTEPSGYLRLIKQDLGL